MIVTWCCIHVDSISTLGVACCTLLGRVDPLGAGPLQRGRWDRRGGARGNAMGSAMEPNSEKHVLCEYYEETYAGRLPRFSTVITHDWPHMFSHI